MWFKKKKSLPSVSFEEVLLDAENLGEFEQERMEGRIEMPLSPFIFFLTAFIIGFTGIVFFVQSFMLTLKEGDKWQARAEQNHFETVALLPPRGVFFDRFGSRLFDENRQLFSPEALSHIIGFVGKDKGKGKAGLEEVFDGVLRGIDGEHSLEVDARGKIISEGIIRKPIPGKNKALTLDAELQHVAYNVLKESIVDRGFKGGAAVIFDVTDGEILSLVSVPGYDANALGRGGPPETIEKLRADPALPFFNRAIAGRYHPGSIIKPIVAAAALEEHVISPLDIIISEGALRVPDPYRPGEESVFLDWKAHGPVDMRQAIAVSSNVYFYVVGGGFKNNKGLGISRLEQWFQRFGLGSKTNIALAGEAEGVLPDPDQKARYHPENPEWRLGDTYHASIGQGDFLVTPLQIARALSLIANNGTAPAFRFTLSEKNEPNNEESFSVALKDETFRVIKEGMRRAVQEGTAAALAHVPAFVAGKTGTAEFGDKRRVHSWFMGFAPYEKPRIGMVVLLESGPRENLVGSPYAASQIFDWIVAHRDYLKRGE